MNRAILACLMSLGVALAWDLLPPVARGDTLQKADTPDAEYRKLDTMLARLRARNAENFALPKDGIDEASYVSLGGIEQWVTIRGYDRANPILLFLHGGPGDVTNPWSFALFAPWERQFTVVQWDERGSGRTFRKNGRSIGPTMTVERMAQDGIELAEYLRKHLGKEKVIIVAHSFGTLLGLRMVRARPDLFYAYVGTGQVADEHRNYEVAYDALLKKARALGNGDALAQLNEVGRPPYQNGRGYRVQWRWANAFEGADQFLFGTIGLALVAPGHSAQDLIDSEGGQILSGERLVGEHPPQGPKELGLDFAIPMFVFQGAEDFTTPTSLARSYVDAMKAPQKAFVPIEGGGHFAVFMKSDRFLQELVQRVRPLAVGH